MQRESKARSRSIAAACNSRSVWVAHAHAHAHALLTVRVSVLLFFDGNARWPGQTRWTASVCRLRVPGERATNPGRV